MYIDANWRKPRFSVCGMLMPIGIICAQHEILGAGMHVLANIQYAQKQFVAHLFQADLIGLLPVWCAAIRVS